VEKNKLIVQQNYTYPNACYPDCQLSGSAWTFG